MTQQTTRSQPLLALKKVSSGTTAFVAGLYKSFFVFASDIKLAHSIFALPFAAAALVVAPVGLPTLEQLLLLAVAMVAARTYAMGINRVVDHKIDARNVRTKVRAIPDQRLSLGWAWVWTVAAAAVFVTGSFALGAVPGRYSFAVLGVFTIYPFVKRFSSLAHFYLGFCLALAPTAVGVALTGGFYWELIFLGVAILFWTAGFDILYAVLDYEFDRREGLYSIPSKLGIAPALRTSQLCFFVTFLFLLLVGRTIDAAWIYYVGVVLVALILMYEHWLIREVKHTGTSSKIGAAFFNANAVVSVTYFVFALLNDIFRQTS